MVDFNNETTISRPADEIVKILILERRQHVFDMLEFHDKKSGVGVDVDIAIVRSRVWALFLQIRATYKRHKPDEYKRLYALCRGRKIEELIRAVEDIDDFLDDLQLTRFDNKVKLGGNIIERNRAHGVPI